MKNKSIENCKDATTNKSESRPLQLFPVRIIPVDLGYKIDSKKEMQIYEIMLAKGVRVNKRVRLFGEDALFEVECSDKLSFYVFADGVGVFAYQDDCIEFAGSDSLNADRVLTERRNAHKGILNHCHPISSQIHDIVEPMRNIVKHKKRRKTSLDTWESRGLSYVMSFYLLNAEKNIIGDSKVQEWLGNLLFTDRHTYFGAVNDYFEKEKAEQVMMKTAHFYKNIVKYIMHQNRYR